MLLLLIVLFDRKEKYEIDAVETKKIECFNFICLDYLGMWSQSCGIGTVMPRLC